MAQPKNQTTRRFVDRMGRTITDPDSIERRRIGMQLRRLSTINTKAGREWPETVTVGELAAATKVSAERVIEQMNSGYLTGVSRTDGPKETWWVYEDGE